MSIEHKFTPEQWQKLREHAAMWRTPHLHLTLALIRALGSEASSSNAFVRSVNVSRSPIADPSLLVQLARRWDPHFPIFMVDTEIVHTKNPFACAFLHDYFDFQGSWIYPWMDSAKLFLLQLHGVTGSVKDPLIEQWAMTCRNDLHILFRYGSRAERREKRLEYASHLGRPTRSISRVADGLCYFGWLLDANKLYGNDLLISRKRIFDLFFDIMAAVPPPRRNNFMRRLARRIKTNEYRCEANLVLMTQLRKALKNDIKNLTLEEINARFP